MVEPIEDFKKLDIREDDIPKKKRIDVSIGILKDNIQNEVHLWEFYSLEKAFRLARKVEIKIMAARNLPLTTINMEVLFLLAFHNLQG